MDELLLYNIISIVVYYYLWCLLINYLYVQNYHKQVFYCDCLCKKKEKKYCQFSLLLLFHFSFDLQVHTLLYVTVHYLHVLGI